MLLTAYFEFGVNNSTIIIGPKRTVKSGVKVTGKERSAVDKAAALTSINLAWVRVPVHDDYLCWLCLLLLLFSKSFFSGYGFPSKEKPACTISKSAAKVSSSGRGRLEGLRFICTCHPL